MDCRQSCIKGDQSQRIFWWKCMQNNFKNDQINLIPNLGFFFTAKFNKNVDFCDNLYWIWLRSIHLNNKVWIVTLTIFLCLLYVIIWITLLTNFSLVCLWTRQSQRKIWMICSGFSVAVKQRYNFHKVSKLLKFKAIRF